MTTQTKPTIRKPENFDLKKGEEMIMRLIRRNQEWVKEMAKK
jgi:hypothetical protein